MRTNSRIRIGAVLIGIALLFGVFYLFRNRDTGPNLDANATNNGGANAVPVSVQPGNVFVAREDIPERSIVTADMLMPGTGEARTTDVTNPEAQAIGYITARAIRRGDRIAQGDLLGHITKVGIAAAVRPCLRAMIVPIVNKPTLHDLVHIGNYVDVVAAFDQQESRTIVSNVRVLAVDAFGKDYPPVRVAMRGPYRAPDPHGVGGGNTAPVAGAPGQPGGQPGASPADGAPAAEPTPTPTPAPNGPPPMTEPALTLEVTPAQATAISLAQASNSPLDVLIHSHADIVGPVGPGTATGTGTDLRLIPAVTTKAQLAPYADRIRRARPAVTTARRDTVRTTNSGGGGGGGGGGRRPIYNTQPVPDYPRPEPPGGGMVAPAPVDTTPRTYNIPVYADGKVVRMDTVPKPRD